jgi:hypothetical protein
MAKPAARRLLDVIKKKRRKAIVSKLIPGRFGTINKKRSNGSQGPTSATAFAAGPNAGPFALTW